MTPTTETNLVYQSIGEAALALDMRNLERVQLRGRSVTLAEEDETGRGWLDLQSDAKMLGVRVEAEPHPGGKVWVIRN